MEVMEDGNLMDKVNILIQRDMEYYKSKQSILQETICPGVIGGKLDFPRTASFASVKLVLWWEEEFRAAHKISSGFLHGDKKKEAEDSGASASCEGMVKDSDPSKFVSLISKSADEFLKHLHILTQEALDHADLSVLTGTIGAAALLKNCLWFYNRTTNNNSENSGEELHRGYKRYNEMCEALAERLLDLHCRLLSLYILQDAECLDWENDKPFFESERGSYYIQMWWLYMKGTREDLWNTVPPKMAQRVFSGMLNESLTILTVRFTQSVQSEARSQLLAVDISNLLLCVAQLLPSICESAKELIGLSLHTSSKILRDIHTKCQELLICLLMRGSPLEDLFKVFKKGLHNVEIFKPRGSAVAPWIILAMPNIFRVHPTQLSNIDDSNPEVLIALELMVLLAQPQPNWALLLKVLCMKKCKILSIILGAIFDEHSKGVLKPNVKNSECGSFLCNGDSSCRDVVTSSAIYEFTHYYDLISAGTEVMIFVGNESDLSDALLPLIIKQPNWSSCFERRHVWNQIRSPWYEAILNFAHPLMEVTTDTVVNALQTGATMYQAMSLILACFSHFWESVHPTLTKVANLIQDHIMTDTVPLSNSCLLQILVCALYSNLLKKSENTKKEVRIAEEKPQTSHQTSLTSFDATSSSPQAIALATAESLCSIDEDNKHTDQIEEFLEQVRSSRSGLDSRGSGSVRVETNQQMVEILASDVLMTTTGTRSLKTLHHFLKCNSEWLYQELGISENKEVAKPNRAVQQPLFLLHTMFHIGYRPFDQLLSGGWRPNWVNLIQTPMGMTNERIWRQISLRWEFRNPNAANLTSQHTQIVNNITSLFKQ
ncbi:uncharacterized protein KIAA0825 isoform X1 [Leptinotarsa decemlineata]|uniref:uncharacterized protein KIAA0825 isoform X1 n=1 Tax=Leptinotarsa decemlineata TaxID=7539 RepID=UPI003D3065B2